MSLYGELNLNMLLYQMIIWKQAIRFLEDEIKGWFRSKDL